MTEQRLVEVEVKPPQSPSPYLLDVVVDTNPFTERPFAEDSGYFVYRVLSYHSFTYQQTIIGGTEVNFNAGMQPKTLPQTLGDGYLTTLRDSHVNLARTSNV